MLEILETAFYAVVAVGTLAYYAHDRFSTDESPIDEAKRLYSEGRIDEPELERRLGEAVDDRHEQIRLVVEDINGVGPATSKAIAREFDSLDGLRESERARLEDVYGVGDETVGAVLERVRER